MAPPNRPRENASGIGEEDLRAWMAQYGPALRRYFHRRAFVAEAEDLVQDVFVAMQARGSPDAIDNVEGYLFRIAANVLARRRLRPSWDWSRSEPLDGVAEPADEVSPERVLIGKQEIERIFAALEDMPRSGEAFVLHRFEEMTYDAIAARMGVTRKSVGKLIKRAVKRITKITEAGR